ncbi:hypothetical protein LZ480_16370 [Solibacillus sp. MA9]|uniref:Tetratricopeptide repeat protein n=1 Tax=Solibacillus palustris TaxID=2908203 RepID=A0ABS9UGI9_9BACL|nr:hypothetical protein [Solibacillus sp. MA9]MCH7323451.1 hypothetical protein [Solibacillus sp. MA9]
MNIYEKFNQLLADEKNEEILVLLEEFRNNRTLTVEEKAWVYWNISDRLAIMRKPHQEYEIHCEFVKWGKITLAPDKLHWFVSDGTQSLTLSLGNYFEEWYDWYLYACEHSLRNESNRGVRFESHRAAVSSLLSLEKFSSIDVPLINMLDLIQEDSEWENNPFAELTYYSFLLEKASKLEEQELIKESSEKIAHLINHKLLEILDDSLIPMESDPFVLGSWEQLNSSRLTKRSITVALNNLGCTLTRLNMHEESVRVFNLAIQYQHKLNKYGLSLYLLSIWGLHNCSSKVVKAWKRHGDKIANIKELLLIAPELKNVDWDRRAL